MFFKPCHFLLGVGMLKVAFLENIDFKDDIVNDGSNYGQSKSCDCQKVEADPITISELLKFACTKPSCWYAYCIH